MADILNPPGGTVTLRSAIQQANNTPGGNEIDLNIPGEGEWHSRPLAELLDLIGIYPAVTGDGASAAVARLATALQMDVRDLDTAADALPAGQAEGSR